MTVDTFLARFDHKTPTGGQCLVRCPGHDDRKASLAVRAGDDGRILLRCHAGCTTARIVGAMGLTEADLFEKQSVSPKRRVVKVYDYHDEAGQLVHGQVSELQLEGAKLDEIDVEGLLGFAEHVLGNAATLWLEADVDQKQRIQRALFPKGLEFEDGRIGTPVTCLAFSEFRASINPESGVASPTGTDTNYQPVFRGEFTIRRRAA